MVRHVPVIALMLGFGLQASAAPDGRASVEKSAVPGSSEEMLVEAKATVSMVQGATRRANKVREQADRDNDGKLAECIEGPLGSLRTLEGVATQKLQDLSDMIADGDAAGASRVSRALLILEDKASTLAAQADACTADGQVQEGNSTVAANADALSDEDDTSPLLGDVLVDIDPPPVTPFQ